MSNASSERKVLHIITGLNDGGAEGVLTRLCLHSHQLEHVVISLMDAGKYGPLLTDAGVVVHCLGMNPGKPSPILFYRLIKLIRAARPDVVQTWMYHADLLGGIAARLAGVRRVFWGVRHSTLEKGKSKRSTIMIAHLCALLSKWIPEKIICCANKALTVHSDIGYQKSKLIVIPNGYDLMRFKVDPASGERVRIEMGLASDIFLIGMVGRYDPLKDHSNLLQALAHLAERQIDFHCLLVGKGMSADNTELKARVIELGLENKVLLAGQRSDIPAVMNALDLHVLSSSSEGFPNVLAEAMACGTPCVSTDVGDACEILGNELDCCPAGDSKALSKLILNMAEEWKNNPSAWQTRKSQCVQRIANGYSIGAMVGAYEACWFDQH